MVNSSYFNPVQVSILLGFENTEQRQRKMGQDQTIEITVPNELSGIRLDSALATLLPDYSRTRLKTWILDGRVLVDERLAQPRKQLSGGERIRVEAILEPVSADQPENIPLDIIHEDEDIIVLNKPAGLVVHPGAGNLDGTLVNALLHHDAALADLPRAGVVHRLDKDTSGIMVIARNLPAQTRLVQQIQAREVNREYHAIVSGTLTAGGSIDAPIGRHPVQRTRMAVSERGKPALTHYRVVQRYRAHTHIRVTLATGRTHQIRVHMAHIRYPILGDPVYGERLRLPRNADETLRATLRGFKRQALHAARLTLNHPAHLQPCSFEAPLPPDLLDLIAALASDHGTGPGSARP